MTLNKTINGENAGLNAGSSTHWARSGIEPDTAKDLGSYLNSALNHWRLLRENETNWTTYIVLLPCVLLENGYIFIMANSNVMYQRCAIGVENTHVLSLYSSALLISPLIFLVYAVFCFKILLLKV